MYYAIDRETEEILNLLHRLEHQCDAPPGTIEDGLKELSWALEGPVSMVALVQYILDHGDKEKAKQIRKERQCIRKRYERYSIT